MNRAVMILTGDPTIEVLAEQRLDIGGMTRMAEWVRTHRPECLPEGFENGWDLFPHNLADGPWPAARSCTANELLCELAGRKCYDSFADKAGKKTNRAYLEHIASMDPMHASIFYHAKMTFFFAGISRKMSHQLIRNYVGSDRDEEGSPSQESTRFTHHYGWYVAPTLAWGDPLFRETCQDNYNDYLSHIDRFSAQNPYAKRKEIYEAAAGILNMFAETSFVWTTNPMAIRKLLKERCHGAADAEFRRFARKLARVCFERWPNLFLGKDLDGVRKELESNG